jgi:hypothetical protein
MRDTEPRQPYAAWSSSECCVDCRNACASSRHFIARSSNTSRRLGSTVLAAARIQSSACTAPHVDSVQKLKSGAHMVGGGPPFSVQSGRTPPRQKGISLGETQNSRGSVGGGTAESPSNRTFSVCTKQLRCRLTLRPRALIIKSAAWKVLLKKCSRDSPAKPIFERVHSRLSISRWPWSYSHDVIWRRCDQQQTSSPSFLRLNHRERDGLGFPRRDDAVREI